MMCRWAAVLLTAAMVTAACGSDGGDTSATTVETSASTGTATTESPTTTATTSSTIPRTTATTEATTIPNPGPLRAAVGPRTATGLPRSFLAVTDQFVAVEVDTESGEIIREIGTTGNSGTGAAVDGNVLVDAWWDPASAVSALSTCCEPAAGDLTFLDKGADYSPAAGAGQVTGWDVSISPDGRYFLVTGYSVVISSGDGGDEESLADSFDGAGRRPAWLRDRRGVAVAHPWDSSTTPETAWIDVIGLDEDNQVISTVRHEIDEGIADLEVRADGKLVVLVGGSPGYADEGSRAILIDPDTGERITEFGLEPGSYGLSYDNTGIYLLYVTGTGEVRWQGGGRSGSLGTGFISADW